MHVGARLSAAAAFGVFAIWGVRVCWSWLQNGKVGSHCGGGRRLVCSVRREDDQLQVENKAAAYKMLYNGAVLT